MQRIAIRFLGTFLCVFIGSFTIESISLKDGLALLGFCLIYTVIGLILRPLMMVLGLPISIVTMGLFLLVINAWLLMITDWMTPNIQIGGFWNAMLITLVVALIRWVSQVREAPDNQLLHSR